MENVLLPCLPLLGPALPVSKCEGRGCAGGKHRYLSLMELVSVVCNYSTLLVGTTVGSRLMLNAPERCMQESVFSLSPASYEPHHWGSIAKLLQNLPRPALTFQLRVQLNGTSSAPVLSRMWLTWKPCATITEYSDCGVMSAWCDPSLACPGSPVVFVF